MRVIIDVNIWVSFCIGQYLDDLPLAVGDPAVEPFICEALEAEFADVASRPRLAKYIRPELVAEVLQLMEAYGIYAKIEQTEADFVDAKDNYLLDFSRSVFCRCWCPANSKRQCEYPSLTAHSTASCRRGRQQGQKVILKRKLFRFGSLCVY